MGPVLLIITSSIAGTYNAWPTCRRVLTAAPGGENINSIYSLSLLMALQKQETL